MLISNDYQVNGVNLEQVISPSDLRTAIRQELARRELLHFTNYTKADYEAAWFHVLVCNALDKLLKGEITRLMIFEPPRHGKSELVSRRLPAMAFGLNPNEEIIACTYGADLAKRMNRDVQRIIDTPEYRDLFPNVRLSGKNIRSTSQGSYLRNSDIFEIVDYKGSYRGTGVGGAITGMGFTLGIIDDPYKNRQDADSQLVRSRTSEWYYSTFRSRAQKDARILYTATLWHEAGLAYQLLQDARRNPKNDQWVVIRLPALADGDTDPAYDPRKIGEWLWPERYGAKELEPIKNANVRNWEALYQQRPRPLEGSLFKRKDFQFVSEKEIPTRFDSLVWFWDAASTSGDGDYTAGVLVGAYTPLNSTVTRYYILKVVFGQFSTLERENRMKQEAERTAKRFGIQAFEWGREQEPGSSGKDVALKFLSDYAGYRAFVKTSTGSKVARAQPLAAQVEAHNVYVLEDHWTEQFIYQLGSFPNGANDDMVDGATGAFNRIVVPQEIEEDLDYAEIIPDSLNFSNILGL